MTMTRRRRHQKKMRRSLPQHDDLARGGLRRRPPLVSGRRGAQGLAPYLV